jgi:hypothetical protein
LPMPSFRVLVFANEHVPYNQKLTVSASTVAGIEESLRTELQLAFPIAVYVRDDDFDDEYVVLDDFSEMPAVAKVVVRPKRGVASIGPPPPAAAAPPPSAPARSFVLLIAANSFVRTNVKIETSASSLEQLQSLICAELKLAVASVPASLLLSLPPCGPLNALTWCRRHSQATFAARSVV